MPYIVDTDNFGGDYPNEKFLTCEGKLTTNRLVAQWFGTDEKAKVHADVLNRKYNDFEVSRYFKVVSDDYALQPGFEP